MFITENTKLHRSNKIIQSANRLIADILEVQSAPLNYMDSEIDKIQKQVTELHKLTIDNFRQQQMLSELTPLLQNKIELLKKPTKPAITNNANIAAYEASLTGQIRLVIENIYEDEVILLEDLERNTLQSFKTTIYLTSFFTVIILSFIIAIFARFNKLLTTLNISKNKIEASFIALDNQVNTMSIINEMNNILVGSASIKETLEIISLYLKKLLPFTAGIVYIMKSSANYLEATIEWNSPKLQEKIFSPNQCWSLRQGQIHTYYNDEAEMLCEHNSHTPELPSYMCVPMLAQNEIIGVLYLEILQAPGAAQSEIKKLVQQIQLLIPNLAGQIALSISNIKLHEILKTRSTRDPLTSLYNRAYLSETLERDIQRAKRNNISIAVAMMDLDHFKNANDTYGHEAGDTILKKVSTLLIENIRDSDIICRYGGEEILIVLYDSNLKDAESRIDQMRNAISQLSFNFSGVLYSPTASFGIAMYPEHVAEDPDKLIKAADSAMYQSKHNGRNMVTIYKNNP